MKLFLLTFIVATVFLLLFFAKDKKIDREQNDVTMPITTSDLPKPQVTDDPDKLVSYGDKVYRYEYRKIETNDKLQLIPNFKSKLSSHGIAIKYNCDFGINGGFYTKENTPLGLFYTDQSQVSNSIESPTFNALFGLKRNSGGDNNDTLGSDTSGTLSSRAKPVLNEVEGSRDPSIPVMGGRDDDAEQLSIKSNENKWFLDYQSNLLQDSDIISNFEFIFQTGPLYDQSFEYKNFIDTNFARRNLIAEDARGDIYLFTIFDVESRYSGPRLEDIPNIFKTNEIKNIANFIKILNLDGGSASSFIDTESNTYITELKPIGSFLCGKVEKDKKE